MGHLVTFIENIPNGEPSRDVISVIAVDLEQRVQQHETLTEGETRKREQQVPTLMCIINLANAET